MELLIAFLIAFGFVTADDAKTMDKDRAISIYKDNNIDNQNIQKWAAEADDFPWAAEADDFPWAAEADDFPYTSNTASL